MTLFLLNPIGTAGDVHPYIAVGRELMQRGEEVLLITSPNFKSLAVEYEIPFQSIGEPLDADRLAEDKRLQKPYTAWKGAMQWAATGMMREVYATIELHYRPNDTVVLSPVWSLGARIARERFPFYLVNVILNPCLLRSCIDPPILPLMPNSRWFPVWFRSIQYWIADRMVLDPLFSNELNRFRSELSLPPIKRIMNRWWFSPDLALGLFSKTLVPPAEDWPVPIQLVGHTLWDPSTSVEINCRVQAFLKTNTGAIVIVPGSIGPGNDQLLANLIAACRQIERPVLVLTPLRDRLPSPLPERVHHCSYAPLADVLGKCDLIIHSGCIGTSIQAKAAGIPQIVFPQVNDQLDNAARLQRLGIAKSIPSKNISASKMASVLREVLQSKTIRENCKRTQMAHQGSSVNRITDHLINFIASNQLHRTQNLCDLTSQESPGVH